MTSGTCSTASRAYARLAEPMDQRFSGTELLAVTLKIAVSSTPGIVPLVVPEASIAQLLAVPRLPLVPPRNQNVLCAKLSLPAMRKQAKPKAAAWTRLGQIFCLSVGTCSISIRSLKINPNPTQHMRLPLLLLPTLRTASVCVKSSRRCKSVHARPGKGGSGLSPRATPGSLYPLSANSAGLPAWRERGRTCCL